ncbi:taste receptor type 2 member 2-like [Carettochelys insculpta]|uniref:taste receptor type 2 member 2-like n=1 Tax=Carettochelys insculpta TaxID=44489 RepID=UPI003EBFCC11
MEEQPGSGTTDWSSEEGELTILIPSHTSSRATEAQASLHVTGEPSGCLSVYYCVKIATSKQSFFRWLKLRLSVLVPWLLLGSLLYSMFMTSLWRHIGKMNQNSALYPSFRNPSTDAHVHALKSVMAFFIFDFIYCVASILSIGII